MPDGLHVHADLVRPPGQNVDIQQRPDPPARTHRPVRNRRAAFGVNCHFLAVFLAPRDGLVDAPAVLPQIPFNQRAVVLLHLPLLQLAAEGELALVVLCHEQQTAGVLVQPVDDAGAQFAADAAQVVKVVQERGDERAVLIAGGGVNDHAAGLQDDGEVEGTIAFAPMGEGGFGYDPVFFVPELRKTFGQLTAEVKASVSHRGKALRAFAAVLDDYLKGNE